MKWNYYIEAKPAFNQDIYFIRQYMQGGKTVCEGSFGIMKKDGIHPYVTWTYSTYACDDRDITVWIDRKEFNHEKRNCKNSKM